MTVTQYFAGPDDSPHWYGVGFISITCYIPGAAASGAGAGGGVAVSLLSKWFAGSGWTRPRAADLPRLPLLDRSQLVHESDQFLVYPGS